CAPGAGAWPTVWNSISPRRAPKCRPDRNRTVIGKLCLVPAQFRSRPVVAHASGWVAAWYKRAKPRSARPIAISKDVWATVTGLSILPHPLWLPPALLPASFARQQISASAQPAPGSVALKKIKDGRIGEGHGRFPIERARSRSVYR